MPRIMVPSSTDPCDRERCTPCEATKNAIRAPGVRLSVDIRWPPMKSVESTSVLRKKLVRPWKTAMP